MSRSVKKGPYVHPSLLKKVDALNAANDKKVVKTWARASMIFTVVCCTYHCGS